ncbi:transcriptional regulator Kaiso-like [Scleropages formosus]|uniref:Zinc finger and BTB domain containing 33 n=1 Tax=Scleropages formosus TaxID=113540 RepID=A0A8C9V239_SCLFO|nr:transcriptional regulator Kaiso-like [Scleropages formosus]XP_018602135.1 transcriptional regulator Kaiso-like [Scleropages formosus]
MTGLKLISATDTQYSEALLRSLDAQRKAGLFCDVTVVVRGRRFRAHRSILSASSPYFHELFSGAADVIELNCVKPEIFEEVLNYVYSSKIIRVRSDSLKDLIACGQTLGVRFIANLGIPLSHVKGLPGLSKDENDAQSKALQNVEVKKPEQIGLCAAVGAMPVITEAFSLSSQKFRKCDSLLDRNACLQDHCDDGGGGDGGKRGGGGGGGDDDDDDDDDVLFVSKQEPQHKGISSSTNENSECSDVEYVSAGDLSVKEKRSASTNERNTLRKKAHVVTRRQNSFAMDTEGGKLPLDSFPSQAQPDSSTLILPVEQETPDTSTSMPSSPSLSSALSAGGSCGSSNASTLVIGVPEEPRKRVLSGESYEVVGVQKKRVTTIIEKSSDNPGDFKLKLTDVWSPSSPESVMGDENQFEIDSSTSSFKEIAPDGEYACSAFPLNDQPGESGFKVKRGCRSLTSSPFSSTRSSSGIQQRRKAKSRQNYYELIMDGKTFYVCVVCKRSYSCLTSLQRHFNVHSWEKKYPCRYCSRVFALAEYRTKHELQHTGERRYQCLLCSMFFMNYQELSSHCKQTHNQHPSGRKERRDTENHLYRLLPCKTLEIKNYSSISDDCSGIPIISEDGRTYHVNLEKEPIAEPVGGSPAQGKVLNWDDIFVDMGPEACTGNSINHVEGTPEFEFIIPETY